MNEVTTCRECGIGTLSQAGSCYHCGATGTDENRRGAYFPLEYITDFLRYIARRPQLYRVITYDDLCWSEDELYPSDYQSEYKRWRRKTAADRIDRSRIHVLLQHDVDSRPERSMELLTHEAEIGTPSNSMIFRARIDRKALKHDGSLVETPYSLDHELMASLERNSGFVIGYHSNAFERAGYDEDEAQRKFEEDVAELRKRHRIRYFSAHGGVPAPDGRNNNTLPVPRSLHKELIWVHNRNSAIFDGNYSDGGINNKSRPPEPRNLIGFVKTWKPGRRYRILTHPQYYHEAYRDAPVLAQSTWYRDVLEHYSTTPEESLWEKALA